MVTNMATNAQAAAVPNRARSTVFHISDHRVNTLRRREKKSDLIALRNIDCMMLFRVEAAHMQFDPVNNHRPYILFHGKAEGVYLPPSTGLLFPNMCDELDFRPDYPVEAAVSYELSDVEISTLAANGLFNYDWSCQGRVLGAVLEIPCTIDYNAIANTPITYIEIQDRLSMNTSTRKTGYKTLVATFLPYSAQKHNQEKYPKLLKGDEYDRDSASIRKRSLYDTKAVGFLPEFADPDKDTVSFVQAAQARINNKLKEQLEKSNALGLSAEKTSKEITAAVDTIKSQANKAKEQAVVESGGDLNRLDTATLDARLNDMKTRMAYQGAQDIPVEKPKISVDPLVQRKKPDENDRIMTTPITETTLTADKIIEENRKAAEEQAARESDAATPVIPEAAETPDPDKIDAKSDAIRAGVMSADKTAQDVKSKVLSRKDKLAARRQQQAVAQRQAAERQQKMIEAAEDEIKKGLTEREPDREATDVRKMREDAARGLAEAAKIEPEVMSEDDILADLYSDQ